MQFTLQGMLQENSFLPKIAHSYIQVKKSILSYHYKNEHMEFSTLYWKFNWNCELLSGKTKIINVTQMP